MRRFDTKKKFYPFEKAPGRCMFVLNDGREFFVNHLEAR